jgi:hypothetical protein
MNLAVQLVPPVCREIPLPRNAFHQPANYNVDPFHVVSGPSSSSPTQHGRDEAPMECESDTRNLEGKDWNDDLVVVRKTLSSHWTKEVPGYKHAAKQVAPTIKASQATVESMRQNGLPEAMARMVFMCRHYPEFRAQFQRMIDPRYLLDPTQERVIHDMIMLMVKR